MTSRRQKIINIAILILALSIAPISGQAQSAGLRVNLNKLASVTAPNTPIFAKLVTRRNQAVLVNGNGMNTGATILSGTTIETPNEVRAIVQVGQLGSFDFAPGTIATIEFGNDKVTGLLRQGCVVLNTNGKIEGWISTPRGTITKIDRLHGASVNVCLPKGATDPIVGESLPSDVGTEQKPSKRKLLGMNPVWAYTLLGVGGFLVSGTIVNLTGSCCCDPSPSSPTDSR